MASASDDPPRTPLYPEVTIGLPSESPRAGRRVRARHGQAVIVVALGCGGVLGAVSRYAVSLAIPTQAAHFPWDTFLVNVSGSAVLGFILILLLEQFPNGRLARPVIGTGFIGAYTTFSTFMVEAIQLMRDGRPAVAVAYLAASLTAGLLAVWTGMTGARVAMRIERWLQQEP
jgi:fluoride exporter